MPAESTVLSGHRQRGWNRLSDALEYLLRLKYEALFRKPPEADDWYWAVRLTRSYFRFRYPVIPANDWKMLVLERHSMLDDKTRAKFVLDKDYANPVIRFDDSKMRNLELGLVIIATLHEFFHFMDWIMLGKKSPPIGDWYEEFTDQRSENAFRELGDILARMARKIHSMRGTADIAEAPQ